MRNQEQNRFIIIRRQTSNRVIARPHSESYVTQREANKLQLLRLKEEENHAIQLLTA